MKLSNAYPVFLGLTLPFSACMQQEEKAEKPNIIYIMADDLGYGDLGCYGQKIIQTPNIDQMAAKGMRFTQHYAGTSVCAPSRCVLMTGMHTGHAVVRGNKQAEPWGQIPLPDETVTVAELLKSAGYTTGMTGKWGLGIEGSSGDPNNQGFDFFYGYTCQILAHNYFPEYLVKNGEREYLKNEVHYLDSSEWHRGLGSYSTKKVDYSHDLFTTEALDFIKTNKDTPFFLYVPYTIPHNNGEAPEDEKQEVPDFGIYAGKDWPLKEIKGYAAMISKMDADVGKIIEKVKELGLEKNTLIIFTSDNGPMQEEVHEFTAFFNSNGELRGGKRDLYEGGIRTPFIAYWPGTIAEGVVSDHVSAFWDFLPTACDIAGVQTPANIDGISYLPTLKGNTHEQKNHEYLYWEFHEQGKTQALRKGKWKAVRTNLAQNPDASFELYDLEKDPSETENVADQHPEIIEEIKELAGKARTEDPNWVFFGEE